MKSSKVNSPNHYTAYSMEIIDVMRILSKGCDDCFSWQSYANIIKYCMRYDNKNFLEDLRKALKYLEFIEYDFFDCDCVYKHELETFVGELPTFKKAIMNVFLETTGEPIKHKLKPLIEKEIKNLEKTYNVQKIVL